MNTTHSGESVKKKFEIREYQVKGWRDMLSVIKQYLEGTLLMDGKIKEVDNTILSEYSESLLGTMNYKENIHLQSSVPLWMATGSGKSYTMGEMMNKIFKLRNRYFPDHSIKSLVLNDRISLVDQLHTDFIEGRDGKPGFLSEHDIHTQIFHSKADQQIEEAYREDIEEHDKEIDMNTLVNDDEVEIQENTTVSQDTMYFSTLQTAYLKNLDEQITDLDVIIIDEAHKLAGKQKYATLMRFYKPNKHGRLPLVFVLSATMNPILHLVNDPVIQFGLPEYIASRHSPQVNYNLVTTHEWTQEDMSYINDQIIQISLIEDLKEKKRAIADLKEQLEEMLKKSTMTDQDLVTDFLQRAPLLDHTIVFAKDIAQADYLATEFNKQAGNTDTAIAIHSRIDQTDAQVLHAYKSGEKKIIVAVNKLNEGIDMPQTNNIVFWRDTDSDTIFQQQFGRGLRGLEVNVYDYVGGLRNLSWIQGIHQAVEQIHGDGEEDALVITPLDPEEDNNKILGGDEEKDGVSLNPVIDPLDNPDKNEKEENTLPDLPLVDGNTSSESEENKYEAHGGVKKSLQEKKYKKNITIRTLGINDLFGDAPQVDIEGLFQKILKFDEELDLPIIGENGQIEIDGEIYQWVGVGTPYNQLWGLKGIIILERLKKQGEEWKEKYVKRAKTQAGPIGTIVEIRSLEKLIKNEINLLKLSDDETVKIDGKTYYWISSKILAKKIGVKSPTIGNIIEKQGEEWKEKYVKRAKTQTGRVVSIVEEKILIEILKNISNISMVGNDETVEIDGKTYYWISSDILSKKIGVSSHTILRTIKKQGEERKEKNIKKAKSHIHQKIISVIQIDSLKSLFQDKMLPKLGDDGKVGIDGKNYKGIKGLGWEIIKIIKEQKEQWKKDNIREARNKKGQILNVVEIEALRKILENNTKFPITGDDGRVQIDGKNYQIVSFPLESLSGAIIRKNIKLQTKEWKKDNIREAKNKKGQILNVVEIEALRKILKDDFNKPILSDDGRVQIDGKNYQWVGVSTPSEQLWGLTGRRVRLIIKKQKEEWKKDNIREAKLSSTGKEVSIVELESLKELLKNDTKKMKLRNF